MCHELNLPTLIRALNVSVRISRILLMPVETMRREIVERQQRYAAERAQLAAAEIRLQQQIAAREAEEARDAAEADRLLAEEAAAAAAATAVRPKFQLKPLVLDLQQLKLADSAPAETSTPITQAPVPFSIPLSLLAS